MPPDEDAYKKNTSEQYEAMGRFVEAFEAMVNEVRETSISLIGGGTRQQQLVEIALHHGAMSAKPLYDIMRASMVEIIDDTIKLQAQRDAAGIAWDSDGEILEPLRLNFGLMPLTFSPEERILFLKVLTAIGVEYEALFSKRNNLLHATWFIGYMGADDPNSANFHVRKFTTTQTGLAQVPLPTTARELNELSSRCQEVRYWVGTIFGCLDGYYKVTEKFEYCEKRCWLIASTGEKTAFPRKSDEPSA
jgi:hypothetical protein